MGISHLLLNQYKEAEDSLKKVREKLTMVITTMTYQVAGNEQTWERTPTHIHCGKVKYDLAEARKLGKFLIAMTDEEDEKQKP